VEVISYVKIPLRVGVQVFQNSLKIR